MKRKSSVEWEDIPGFSTFHVGGRREEHETEESGGMGDIPGFFTFHVGGTNICKCSGTPPVLT